MDFKTLFTRFPTLLSLILIPYMLHHCLTRSLPLTVGERAGLLDFGQRGKDWVRNCGFLLFTTMHATMPYILDNSD